MSKVKLNSELLVGITAVIISLSTLIVFIYQTNLIRKQQYMSVYPHLDVSNINTGSMNYKFVLFNEGIGPAFITKLEITEKHGQSYDDLVDYLEEKITEQDTIQFHYSDLYEGQLIQAKEEVYLFGLSDNNYVRANGLAENTINSAHRLEEILNSDSLTIKITYESIYGESWTITDDSRKPIKN